MISTTMSYAENSEIVKSFYVSYMTNLLNDRRSDNKELRQKYLTKALIEKNGRVVSATDSDAITHGQDINEDAIETLTVDDLGKDWYMVKYLWKKEDASSETQIPLKAYEIDKEFKIVYICPYWNGTQYGDYLIADKPQCAGISNSSGLSFLTSFYDTYLYEYGLMETDLANRLSKLRDKYLTKNAKADFDKAEQQELLDNREDFDLLVDNFDFEYIWAKSLEITPLNDNDYLVFFGNNGYFKKIKISLYNDKNQYVIDRIQQYNN